MPALTLPAELAHYRAFIFDCDGTLADSMPLHYAAWLEAFARYGSPLEFSWQRFMSRAGKTVELTVQELNAELGLSLDPAAMIAAQREVYEAQLDSVEPLLEVLEFARERVRLSQPVSVASGGEAATVARTLRMIGASHLFPIVITAADVARGKPEPDMFLLAAERMGVSPEHCLVLEDSQLGILAAERAGMGALLVGRQQAPEKYR